MDNRQSQQEAASIHTPGSSVKGPAGLNWEVVTIADTGTRRGLGVFCTRNCDKGQTIIVERPSISCIHWKQRWGRRTIAAEWTKLQPEVQTKLTNIFRRLKNVPTGKKLQPHEEKKLHRFIDEYAFWDPQRDKAHIYILGSHINHACVSCANAEQWTDSQWPNHINVKLVKPVEAGNEVFINYNRAGLSFKCAVCTLTLTQRLKAFGRGIIVR